MAIDVAGAEAALAQARQLLPPLVNQLDQTRDLIRALAGNLPNQDVEEVESLGSLKLPTELPLSLPSKIIEQRPDVRAAEEQMRSANAQVGVAIAARLPQFSITGTAGGGASKFSQMFDNGGPFWSLIGDVSAPLFDGNTLLHHERAANQALIQATEQYRSTVITAYQNVADALHAITTDAEALKASREAEQAAKTILDITLKQNQIGYVDWLTLYSAEIGYDQAELNVIQARAVRFGDTAALYQALGGGWWNRTDQASDNTQGDALLDMTKWLTP
jgi:NodT family efflux transporter outer membrane factor (OMF) lipoprotein